VHASMRIRGLQVGLVVLTTIGLSACSANRAPSSTRPANNQTTIPAATATVSPAATTAASNTPTASPRPATSGGVQNLVSNSTVRGDLTAAFVAHKRISPSDVAGTYPGSVYYAYDPATNTYWAAAQFESSSTAPINVLVGFQDGGNFGLFRRVGEDPWQVQVKTSPPACTEPQFFPPAVLEAWSLPTSTPTPTATNGFHC
jgi:hypothetical protein